MLTALGFFLFAAGVWLGDQFDRNGEAPTHGKSMLVHGLCFSGAVVLAVVASHEGLGIIKSLSGP